MGNIIDDVMGHITPIDKKEVDEFKLLVSEEAFLTENRDKITFSDINESTLLDIFPTG